MYSLVMMTMMAGSGDAAAFHGRSAGCAGYYGPPAVTYTQGCYGSSCNGCYGSSCYGTRFGARHSGIVTMRSNAYFASGSCYGSSCYGSSCYGSSCYGSGCYGSSSYSTIVIPDPYAGGACCDAPGISTMQSATEFAPSCANITIELPATAKLFVDGNAVAGSGTTRQFHTPQLPKGENYFYEMKAEIVVDGQVVVQNLKVVVRSGETIQRTFGELIAATAKAKPSEVAVK